MAIKIEFDRATKVYYTDENISFHLNPIKGEIIKPKSISISIVNLLLTDTGNSYFNKTLTYNYMKSKDAIVTNEIQVPSDKIPKIINDKFTLDFTFCIPEGENTIETFHGSHIYSEYFVVIEIRQGFLKQDIVQTETFTLYNKPHDIKPSGPPVDEMIDFCDPESPYHVDFRCKIHLDTPIVSPQKPPSGFVIVEKAEETIKCISTTFLVIETIRNSQNRMELFQSEVAWVNITEKDPLFNREIPFFVEWQRMKISQTSSSIHFAFSIGYALRIKIEFEFGATSTYDIPLVLYRDLKF